MKASRILDEMHTTMNDLHHSGIVDKKTMRNFDAICLKSIEPMSPAKIKEIREKERVSQALFALCLNTSASSVKNGKLVRKTKWFSIKIVKHYRKKRLKCRIIDIFMVLKLMKIMLRFVYGTKTAI